nr:hypothetical protein [uncultured archaeon]
MSYVSWAVLLICLFTGATLFFSVNGIALRTFSHVKLQQALRRLDREKLTNRVVENAEKLILTCSLYRLFFHMCILLLLVALFARLRPAKPTIGDYALAFIIAMALFSIFSTAIPHAWAKYAGEKILSRTYRLLMLFALIVSPVLYIFGLYDGLIRRLAGIVQRSPEERQEEKQEEFLSDLEQQRTEGVLDREEQKMIKSVLELSETTAAEIMTPRTDIVAVEVSSDLKTILETINNAGHTRVPVFEDNIDNIVGLIYAKDLLAQIGKKPEDFKIHDKMRGAFFVPETKPLRALLHEFQNKKQHIAIVLDEYGGTAGIITLEDILEQLVGEITDEYEKTPAEPIKKIDKDTIEVDARVYIDDLNDKFGLNLPDEEDYDTLGGFVFSRLGYIPKAGESFDYENIKFTITSAEPRRVKHIRIQRRTESS